MNGRSYNIVDSVKLNIWGLLYVNWSLDFLSILCIKSLVLTVDNFSVNFPSHIL